MKARRTLFLAGEHETQKIWAAVAATLSPAGDEKEGFYLTLFPDGRPPAVVFLRPDQALTLLKLARDVQIGDADIWDYVAKIPMEPLLPSRALQPKLRALLTDYADAIRDELSRQAARPRKLEPVAAPELPDPAQSTESGAADAVSTEQPVSAATDAESPYRFK